MMQQKPLVLPRSERFVIARCANPQGFPLELSVIVGYESGILTFQVDNWKSDNEDEFDSYFSEYVNEALSFYNSIVQGEQ